MVEKIKQLCEKEGTTIKSLEKMLALGNGSIRRWDAQIPSVDKVLKVARHFGVSVEYLQSEQEKPTTPEDDGLTATQAAAMEFIKTLSGEQLKRFIAMGKAAFDGEDGQ